MGYGPLVNGKHRPITPYSGSWAESMEKNRYQGLGRNDQAGSSRDQHAHLNVKYVVDRGYCVPKVITLYSESMLLSELKKHRQRNSAIDRSDILPWMERRLAEIRTAKLINGEP